MKKAIISLLALSMFLVVGVQQTLASATPPPVITLLGTTPVSVNQGSTYTDAGATAVVGFGTDVTTSIITTGLPVDTSVLGDHIVTYNVTVGDGDGSISATPVTRTVTVVPVATDVSTQPATGISTTNATLNGTNGSTAADSESFWVSTSTFDVSTPNIPANVYSTPVLPGVAGDATFSDPLSIVTTDGITTGGVPGNMPAITPNTTYYFVAWSYYSGSWHHGEILSFNTSDILPPETATLTIVKHTIGSDGSFQFNVAGAATTSAILATTGGYATSSDITINVGTSIVSEQAQTGWNLVDVSCVYDNESIGSAVAGGESIEVDEGDHVTCTFTNTSTTKGEVRIKKNVVASDASTDVSDSHTFTVVLQNEDSPFTRTIREGSDATITNLPAGTYTLVENADSDYTLVSIAPDENSDLGGAQVKVVAGEVTVVTVTNKQNPTSGAGSSDTGGGAGNEHHYGSIVGGGSGGGQVLGASTDTGGDSNTCPAFLTGFIKFGANNNVEDVVRLQLFLNSYEGERLVVNGIYDMPTFEAVKRFQLAHKDTVLQPWLDAGLPFDGFPTGYVYITTLWTINNINCGGGFPLPVLK